MKKYTVQITQNVYDPIMKRIRIKKKETEMHFSSQELAKAWCKHMSKRSKNKKYKLK